MQPVDFHLVMLYNVIVFYVKCIGSLPFGGIFSFDNSLEIIFPQSYLKCTRNYYFGITRSSINGGIISTFYMAKYTRFIQDRRNFPRWILHLYNFPQFSLFLTWVPFKFKPFVVKKEKMDIFFSKSKLNEIKLSLTYFFYFRQSFDLT